MRQKIVAGNWKMNKNASESSSLISELRTHEIPQDVRVIVAPATVFLESVAKAAEGSLIGVASQNMNAAVSGAYTGEVSSSMLKSIAINTTLLGHSERRAYYNESNESLAKKVQTAQKAEMEIIFCFGEELSDRKAGNHFKVVEEQLQIALFDNKDLDWSSIILAYEPVWAIGTGETATPAQAQEMHAFIRGLLKSNCGEEVANATSILYGGSAKPTNANELFSQTDVDGGLIGGASLVAEDFMAIVNAY